MRETQVPSLGQEDPLEDRAAHSSIPVWRIPRREEPGGYRLWSLKESYTAERLCLSGSLGISRRSVIWRQLRAAPRDEAGALQPVQSSRPPRGGVRVEGPRNPSAFGTEAGAPRPPSVGTRVRSPAARGEGTPAERGGSAASDPSAVIPPRVLGLPFPRSLPSPPLRPAQSALARCVPERASPARPPVPACPTGLGESFRAPGKSSLRERAPSARPA